MNLWFLIYKIGEKEFYLDPLDGVTPNKSMALKFFTKEKAEQHLESGKFCITLVPEIREFPE